MSANAWLKAQRSLAGHALALTIGLNVANGLLAVAQAWCLAMILNEAIFAQADLVALQPWLWTLLGIAGLRALLVRQAECSAFRGAARVRQTLRGHLFRHLQRLGPSYLSGQRSGALSETLTRGIDDLEGYYARFVPAMTLVMILPPALLAVILPFDWISGLALFITAPLIPLFMIIIGSGAEARNRAQWRELSRMGAHFLDVIQGLTTLKLFGASHREGEVIARVSNDYRLATMRVLRVAFLSSAVLEFFATLGIAVVAVLIGFRLYDAAMPLPTFLRPAELNYLHGLFILMLAPEFYAPLRDMGTQYHARMAAAAAAEQIIAVLQTEPPDGRPRPGQLAVGSGVDVRLESVDFCYAPERPALHALSCAIPRGTRVALVGTSGAGKTTVVNLLLGFLEPTRGHILINGQDLAALDLADWRTHLAWVPQQPRLFQGSIGENIRLGAPDASPQAVEQAARRARAHEFIARLPEGYAHPVGERGAGLSGGQIQRIALARAFLRDAPLVILDEPTANLDPRSEQLVQAGIDELAQGRTLLVVAHRLATVRRADAILVLDNGRLVETGTHETLLATGGLYAHMVAAHGTNDGHEERHHD